VAALGKLALVVHPHRHRRRSTMCSVTTRRISRRSNTWRCSVSTTSASSSPSPHEEQETGAWLITRSRSATWTRCLPGAPGCLPCLRAAARHSARDGDGAWRNPLPIMASMSCEGFGRGVLPNRPASTRASPPGPAAVHSRTRLARRREHRERDRGLEFPTVRAVFPLVVDQAVRGPEQLRSFMLRVD
jgi:hypothetical protein